MSELIEKTDSVPANSFLGQLRQKRKELTEQKTLDLNVPGYDGHLVIRYKAISDKELELFGRQAQKDKSGMAANSDLLIRACDDILVREDLEGVAEPLQPGVKTTFSSGTLGELLGTEANSAREEVAEIFSPAGNQPLAASQHAEAVINWLQGNYEEIDKQLLGE